MTYSSLLFPALLSLGFIAPVAAVDPPLESKISFERFNLASAEAQELRAKRLISIETFNRMAAEPSTVILDTRSAKAFERIHIKGAIHLNFSDFTDAKLKKLIPDKNTRILIYCNNNFRSPEPALMDKRVGMALNIPTFINLHGYGYRNIYELKDRLNEKDPRVEFARAQRP